MAGLLERLTALESEVKTLDGEGTTKAGSKNAEKAFGVPAVRTGEDPLSSRGFSFLKMAGVLTRQIDQSQAKVELEVAEVFHKAFRQTGDHESTVPGSLLAPLGMDYLPEQHRGSPVFAQIKALVSGGVAGADPDEMARLEKSYRGSQKSQSWLNETLGGSMIPGPEQGELIQLLKAKDALVAAGAKVIPLPPGGMKWPRQTSASTTYWVGENENLTESQVKTGALNMRSKKIGCLIKTPNELIRFGGPAAEALFRNDMATQLTLGLDKQLLEGTGTDTRPNGILNTSGVATVTPTTVGNNGNTMAPGDVYDFVSKVMANNATFESWILHPTLFFNFFKKRGGGSTGTDGPFLFNQFRQMGDGVPAIIAGYPAVITSQVGLTRTKGSAGNLTYMLGGMFSEMLIGMFGAIEFSATTQGDTSFVADQTWIKAILSCDGGLRVPGGIAVADQLTQTV
ncbi:MAG: phage major capsid protein [Gemmataceae bacterium]